MRAKTEKMRDKKSWKEHEKKTVSQTYLFSKSSSTKSLSSLACVIITTSGSCTMKSADHQKRWPTWVQRCSSLNKCFLLSKPFLHVIWRLAVNWAWPSSKVTTPILLSSFLAKMKSKRIGWAGLTILCWYHKPFASAPKMTCYSLVPVPEFSVSYRPSFSLWTPPSAHPVKK